jgi:hypothetical protein
MNIKHSKLLREKLGFWDEADYLMGTDKIT